MKQLFKFLSLFAFLFCDIAETQSLTHDRNRADANMLKQEGQLLSIRLSIGEPLRIFVVGKEEAKLDLSDLKLTVRRIKPYPGKTLELTKEGDYYTAPGAISLENPTDLEVKTKVNNKEETFHFKIDTKLH